MCVLRIWRVLCVLGCMGASLSMNEGEYDTNCAENYDNEISLDQQEETPAGPCQDDVSSWDKLFIALEDSHMRQNMLLSSVEQCCGGGMPLKMFIDKLSKGTCHQCVSMEKLCKAQIEQTSLKLHQDLVGFREYDADREKNLNVTLQQLLHRTHETNVRLRRVEEGQRVVPRPTTRPGAFGVTTLSSGGFKEEAIIQSLDMGAIGKALIAIATELQNVHLQLNKVIEQTMRTDRGDT